VVRFTKIEPSGTRRRLKTGPSENSIHVGCGLHRQVDVRPSAMSFAKNELAPDELISISSKKMQVPSLISNGFAVTVE
jgi:hypothetical protein